MSLLWGIPYLLIKIAVRDLPPAAVVEARTAIGTAILLPLAVRQGQLRSLVRVWKPFLAYTVVEVAVPWLLLSDAERHLSSSFAGLLVATVPLFGVVLAFAFRHQDRLDRRGMMGLFVGFLGVALLLGFDVHGDGFSVVEVILVAAAYATGPIIAARYFRDISSLALAAVSLALVALIYIPVLAARPPVHAPRGGAIAAVVVLGVVCTALAFVVFFELIREVGSTRAMVFTYLNPAVAVVLGVAFLGERFGLSTAAGFALILVGSWFSTRRRAPIEPLGQPQTP